MLFLPNDDELAAAAKAIVEDVVAAEGRCHIVHWRQVPVDGSIVGKMAKRTQPRIWQVHPCPWQTQLSCACLPTGATAIPGVHQ